ncbi:DUF6341 family protein [Tenacibaculum sp. TC6]|uniref:DUF6341 family protein n=1 Tax=Tenacibaculum sp. TC6 TaxID=3423223 RepID=UPI003D360786
MLGLNIFRLIGDLFKVLFTPFEWIRLSVAKSNGGWWTSNALNWIFLVILILLLAYWMKESVRFKNEGTEDRA